MPFGAVGELYVGGRSVGLGYIERDELNAQSFFTNPWHSAERIYKTGDLVRYREDGALVFLSRVDYQIKLRGLRIELDEIATQLRAIDDVSDVLVTVYTPDAGSDVNADVQAEEQLLAYVVLAAQQQDALTNK